MYFEIPEEMEMRVKYNKVLDDKYYNMMKRCYDENNKDYRNYGQRGITVCEEWRESKQRFMRWCVDNGFESGLEIDRIDNDKGYGPTNCRFVTRKENINNRRCSVKKN